MPLLSAKQQIAIKQEATAGTAESLAAANVVLHTGRATFDPDVPMLSREAMSASLSPRGSISGTRAGKISFKMFLRGTAIAPVVTTNEPDFSVPFKACGADITVSGGSPNEQSSFKPSTAIVSLAVSGAYSTIALYEDGKVYRLTGAVGNCKLTFNVSQPVLAEFDFTGVYGVFSDTGLLSPTYPTVIEPVFRSAAISIINSYTSVYTNTLTLDFGNQITMRPYPNNAAGLFTAQITGRNPTGTFEPEGTLTATNAFYTQLLSGTTGAITTGVFPSTGTNYNQFSLTIPNAAYTNVGHGDRDGIVTAPVTFECRANSDAGNDEWELVQT